MKKKLQQTFLRNAYIKFVQIDERIDEETSDESLFDYGTHML